jgi:hypothetical protein
MTHIRALARAAGLPAGSSSTPIPRDGRIGAVPDAAHPGGCPHTGKAVPCVQSDGWSLHAAFIFVIDREGRLRLMVSFDAKIDDLAHGMRLLRRR